MRKRPDHTRLAAVPLLEGCSAKQLAAVAKCVDEYRAAPGEVLAAEGRPGHEVFVVGDGAVAVTRRGRPVADLGPGALVGELSVIDGKPRSATVTAVTATTLYVFSAAHFSALLDEIPTLRRRVLGCVGVRLRDSLAAGDHGA